MCDDVDGATSLGIESKGDISCPEWFYDYFSKMAKYQLPFNEFEWMKQSTSSWQNIL